MTRSLLACALLSLLAACSPRAEPDVGTPRHVVVIVIDATQAAQLGCYGGADGTSPQIDAFARTGTRFANATASATWTLPSTTSLLTGLLQEHHGVVTNHHALAADGAPTLPELFVDAGWRTAAFVQMVYASDAYGLDRGFDTYTYYASAAEKREDGRAVLDVLGWLSERAADNERSFTYAHFRRPHSPYDPDVLSVAALGVNPTSVPHERLEMLMHADSRVRDIAELRSGELDLLRGLYRANVRAIDERLASVFEWAAARDDVLVILTADHGEGLGEHEHFGHGDMVHPEHVGIPLIIAGPGVPTGVNEARVATVDVAATLADICALDTAPRDFDGVSLVPLLRGMALDRDDGVFVSGRYRTADNPPTVASKDARWSLVRHGNGDVALYDLVNDPDERTDVASDHPDVIAARLAQLERLVDRGVRNTAPGAASPQLDDERRAALRDLGYIDDSEDR